jgi:hypothetical protein
MKKWIALALAAWLFTGCASMGLDVGVEPWERELLSDEAMTFGSNPTRLGYEQHTYFSKEATSGGSGFSGGGCGCN